LACAFGFVLSGKQTADVTLLRGLGVPFTELTPGEITNQIRVKVKNRSGQDAEYAIALADGTPGKFATGENPVPVTTDETRTVPVLITLPRTAFKNGRYDVTLLFSDGQEFQEELTYRLIGPHRSGND